jgi:invasion protein IalB
MPSHRVYLVIAVIAIAGCVSAPQPEHAKATNAAASPAAAGYREVVRNGFTLYCRNQVKTGSIMTEEVCLTAEQFQQNEERTRMMLNDARRNTPP